jgi:hypothetical protein
MYQVKQAFAGAHLIAYYRRHNMLRALSSNTWNYRENYPHEHFADRR